MKITQFFTVAFLVSGSLLVASEEKKYEGNFKLGSQTKFIKYDDLIDVKTQLRQIFDVADNRDILIILAGTHFEQLTDEQLKNAKTATAFICLVTNKTN